MQWILRACVCCLFIFGEKETNEELFTFLAACGKSRISIVKPFHYRHCRCTGGVARIKNSLEGFWVSILEIEWLMVFYLKFVYAYQMPT